MEAAARPAGPDDLEIVVALAEGAIEELVPLRGGSVWSRREARTRPVAEGLHATIEAPDSLVVAGTIDDTVVGYAAVTLVDLHDGSVLGDLTDLYVLPGARGVGVGEAMMDEVVDWCTQRDCVGIDSLALPGDRATKNFFETFGLVARAIRVHRRLGDS